MKRAPYIVGLSFVVLAACGPAEEPPEPAPETWLDTRSAGDEPPVLLSDVGIYLSDGSTEPHPAAIPYEPQWPLWSNGLSKDRLLVLPDGATVGVEDDDWEFPTDTMMFKTFSDDDGPVETRLMWKSNDGWQWSTYVWDDRGQDAGRTDGRRSVDVDVVVDGEAIQHKVPNEIDCRKCHEPDANGVLGFEPLQLGEAGDSFDVFDEQPSLQTVEHDDPETRELLGWFVGNCTSCHNGAYEHDQSSFSLLPADALGNIVNVETESSASAQGIRVVPGDPEASILFQAVSGETDDPEVKPMPPVGVQQRDSAAISALRAWIEELE